MSEESEKREKARSAKRRLLEIFGRSLVGGVVPDTHYYREAVYQAAHASLVLIDEVTEQNKDLAQKIVNLQGQLDALSNKEIPAKAPTKRTKKARK